MLQKSYWCNKQVQIVNLIKGFIVACIAAKIGTSHYDLRFENDVNFLVYYLTDELI